MLPALRRMLETAFSPPYAPRHVSSDPGLVGGLHASSRRYVPSYIGMHTVHTYRSYAGGEPYGYLPEIYVQPVYRLRELVKAVRDAMEDGQEYISIFNERGNCTGLWINESEPEPDGEGGMVMGRLVYVLQRPEEDHQELFTNAVNRLLKR